MTKTDRKLLDTLEANGGMCQSKFQLIEQSGTNYYLASKRIKVLVIRGLIQVKPQPYRCNPHQVILCRGDNKQGGPNETQSI